MKAPKEIYLLQKGSQLLGTWSGTPQMEISGGWYSAEYKYIRADLVEQKPALDDYLKATPAGRRKMSMTEILEKEQHPKIIQWTGKNLKEVIDFTGKSPRFDEWFKSWEEYENYVHTHNDILKLFCEDGSHYEVPVGAWIVKTPDGYNVPSVSRFVQEQPEVELERELRDYFSKWGYNIYNGVITMDNDIVATLSSIQNVARHFWNKGYNARKEESVSIAESPSKTFLRVNEFDCDSSYRH